MPKEPSQSPSQSPPQSSPQPSSPPFQSPPPQPSLFQRGLLWLRAVRKGTPAAQENSAAKPGGDVVIGEVGTRARNVIIGKNNLQINIAGRLLTLPVWLILIALIIVAVLLATPFVEPLLFPTQMTGGMNIAITDFGQMDAGGHISPSTLGATLSQSVYNKLEQEYQETYPELLGRDARSVEIWQDSMGGDVKNIKLGMVTAATPKDRAGQAKALAQKINADVVIYGYLQDQGDENSLRLNFYYAGDTLNGEPDTVSGRHVLSNLIAFPIALQQEPMAVQEFVNEALSLRAKVLFWITVALVFDVTDQQARALQTLQEAQATLTDLHDNDGQALLQYFIGREAFWLREYDVATTALNKAISLKPNYANAYIGLGGVHYDRAQLFYAPKPVPAELAECITTEHIDNAAQSADEAMSEIDQSISLLQKAVEVAPSSPWPPIEFPARLALGQALRLKGQAYLLAGQPQLGQEWFTQSLAQFDLAQSAFEQTNQLQYIAWSHLGRAAAYQLQAYTSLALIQPSDDKATTTAKRQVAATLFQKAADECQHCLDKGKTVADLVFQKKVLRCGCQYLQGIDKAAHAQLQKLMEEP